jgi:hypothetical protein
LSSQLSVPPDPLRVCAVLAAASGVIHIEAAIAHTSHWWLFGVFFAGLAYAQLGWALVVYRGRRDTRLLEAAIYVSLAVAAIWLWSRTVGLPVGPWAWDAEGVGITDTVSTLDELALAALLTMVLRPAGRIGRALGWIRGDHATRLGMMLGSASVLALAMAGHGHH